MATRVLPLVAEVGIELYRVKLNGGSLGGYKCDILTEKLNQREINTYKCPRCEGIMKDGVISNTREQLCVCCLREGEKLLCDVPIRDIILSLKCSCPLSKRGCGWLGTLESVENHLTTCGRVHVSCELRCEVVTSRDGMGRHVREECSQRKEACLHCSRVLKACGMEEHVKVCGKVKMKCELGCGTRVCRNRILRHRANDCPEETVVCPYKKYRCEVVGLKRRELKQHFEDNRILHLELKVNALEEQIDELKEEVMVRVDGAVEWDIHTILHYLKPNREFTTFGYSSYKSEVFIVAGYRFLFYHTTDSENFNIFFELLKGFSHSSLEWPLKAIFITRVYCHKWNKQHLVLKSPIIEIQKDEFTYKGVTMNVENYSKLICSIPLSTNLEDFIREDSLNLEVTIRMLKNK